MIDALCFFSLVGIWPRFIEPKLLKQSRLRWHLPPSCASLQGLKIVHLTDLHFHQGLSSRFLNNIRRKIEKLRPDLLVFTGDFICYSRLEDEERLLAFLQSLKAPLGCFCTLGNHDYSAYVSRNPEGIYDVLKPANPIGGLLRGLKALKQKKLISQTFSPEIKKITLHQRLCELLGKTSFKLLENTSTTLPIGLNIVGLGDYTSGRLNPDQAFATYNPQFPGLILTHNPDAIPSILKYPGNFILAGHTHGEQIHFPFPSFLRKISQRLTRLEYPQFARGYHTFDQKKAYINRGLGCHKPVRFCSPPEIFLLEIHTQEDNVDAPSFQR